MQEKEGILQLQLNSIQFHSPFILIISKVSSIVVSQMTKLKITKKLLKIILWQLRLIQKILILITTEESLMTV
jgi:hypothetical protein